MGYGWGKECIGKGGKGSGGLGLSDRVKRECGFREGILGNVGSEGLDLWRGSDCESG